MNYRQVGGPGVRCFWVGMAPLPVRLPAQLSLAQQVRIKQAPAGPLLRGQNREEAELTLPAGTPGPAPPSLPTSLSSPLTPSVPGSSPAAPQTPRAHMARAHRGCMQTQLTSQPSPCSAETLRLLSPASGITWFRPGELELECRRQRSGHVC